MEANRKTYAVRSSATRAAKQAGLSSDQYTVEEKDGRFLFVPIVIAANVKSAEPTQAEVEATFAAAQQAADAQANNAETAGLGEVGVANIPLTHQSVIQRPCKKVWWIADEMLLNNPSVKRKEVLAECVAQGIAYYTARTQYQQWLQCQKEMAARVASQSQVNKDGPVTYED